MPSSAFSPKTYFTKLIKQWWILFLAIAIGGLIGVGLSYFRQPRYEAEAYVSSSIDYTLLPELEDYEEDRIINEAGWVMLSDDVLMQVQADSKQAGLDLSLQEIRDRFSADRIDDLWALRVVGHDAQEVSTLANIWADVSYQHLSVAHAYALEGSAIRAAIAALENCQQESTEVSPALCETADMDTLQLELDTLTAELEDALALSQGLNPASQYTINSYAIVPLTPSYQARGIMAFLGMIFGMTAGMIYLWFFGKKE